MLAWCSISRSGSRMLRIRRSPPHPNPTPPLPPYPHRIQGDRSAGTRAPSFHPECHLSTLTPNVDPEHHLSTPCAIFLNLPRPQATDKRGKTYAVFLADTVLVAESGSAEVYSDKAPKQWADVSYYLKDNDGEEDEEEAPSRRGRGEVEILESRTRGSGRGASEKQDNTEQLHEHQAELEERMRSEALSRIKNQGGSGAAPSASTETPIAYRSADHYPQTSSTGGSLKTNQTHVDVTWAGFEPCAHQPRGPAHHTTHTRTHPCPTPHPQNPTLLYCTPYSTLTPTTPTPTPTPTPAQGKNESLLVPMFGRLVPFHISTIKNVSKSEEGAFTHLRRGSSSSSSGGLCVQGKWISP